MTADTLTITLIPTAEADRATAERLARETVVLELRISAPSFRRKLPSTDLLDPAEEPTDPELIHVSKDLIDRYALGEIGQADSRFRRWLRNRTISCSMLRGGMWLVPLRAVEDVDRGIASYRAERARLVGVLVERHEQLKADARARLGRHYNPADYPPASELARAFGVRARFLSFNVPAALADLNRELYERERARVETEWSEAYTEIRTALREAFAGLVEHLADRLGQDDQGKPKTFRDSTVQQMQDFLETFGARNLTGDQDLAELAEQARALIQGVSPETLRKAALFRERVREGMEQIKAKLDTLVVTKRRSFALDEAV